MSEDRKNAELIDAHLRVVTATLQATMGSTLTPAATSSLQDRLERVRELLVEEGTL